jgi:hypothetical protein
MEDAPISEVEQVEVEPPAEPKAEPKIEPKVEPKIEPKVEPKKRGRPPGAKNKPKIVEIPAPKVQEPVAEEVKEAPALLSRAQVHQLLKESYRIAEIEASEARRQRYAALFAKR